MEQVLALSGIIRDTATCHWVLYSTNMLLVMALLVQLGAGLGYVIYESKQQANQTKREKCYDSALRLLAEEQGDWYVRTILEAELAKVYNHYAGGDQDEAEDEDEATGDEGDEAEDEAEDETEEEDEEEDDGGEKKAEPESTSRKSSDGFVKIERPTSERKAADAPTTQPASQPVPVKKSVPWSHMVTKVLSEDSVWQQHVDDCARAGQNVEFVVGPPRKPAELPEDAQVDDVAGLQKAETGPAQAPVPAT